MSLRRESIGAYRDLYRAAARGAEACGLYNCPGLLQYVSRRYGQESELHHRQLTKALRAVEKQISTKSQGRQRKGAMDRARIKILSQYQQYISSEIDRTRATAQALSLAADNAPLTSVLQVLSAGVGSAAYQQVLEASFLSFVKYDEKRASRDEVSDGATSERQNRIMLQALLPYAERLLLVHRTAIGEQNRESSLQYLTPWQVMETIVGNRSGVSAVHLRVGIDHIVVEVDETYNKQVVYVSCTRREGGDSGSYEWAQDIERVEISESEEVQKTLFHSEFLFTASRICDALLHDSPLHPTRSTVIVGHAVGGAVGLILSLLLSQRGFEVANTISLGAPKALQGTLERYAVAINAVRLVMDGDPLVELPVTGAEGAPFVHIGEILLLSPPGATSSGSAASSDQEVSSSPPSTRENSRRAADGAQSDSADALTPDMLSSMMMEAAESANPDVPSAERRSVDDDGGADDDAEETESDFKEQLRVAEERYRNQFLVEDYVRQMQSPAVGLTYAEGDDVWDDGDYAAMRRSVEMEPSVSVDEHRLRDMRGPL